MAKKPKIANLPPPKIPTDEEIKKLIEEGKKLAEEMSKPKEPGDYDVGSGYSKLRGKKLEKNCMVCNGKLEHLWERFDIRPDFIGPGNIAWRHRCTRCDTCGLKYDLTGLK